MSSTTLRSNRIFVALLFTAALFTLHILYKQSSQSTARRFTDLQDKIQDVRKLEESIHSLVETLKGTSQKIDLGVSTVQEKLDETLQSVNKKETQLEQFHEGQKHILDQLREAQQQQQQQLEQQLNNQQNQQVFAALPLQPNQQRQQQSGVEKTNKKRHRIYNVTLFNDEAHMLEIHLNELYDLIDVFVLIEYEITFSGKPKPLHFLRHEARFRRFREKLLHIVVPNMKPEHEERYKDMSEWKYEKYIRDEGMRLAIQSRKPNDGDWIMVADLDELPRQEFLRQLREPDLSTELGRLLSEDTAESVGDLFRITCHFYHFSYEYRIARDTIAPVFLRYRDEDSPYLTKAGYPDSSEANLLRSDWKQFGCWLRWYQRGESPVMLGQCRHCSFCFPTLDMILNKMSSYSHQEFNTEQNRDKKMLLDRARSGVDVFARWTENMDYIENNTDVPDYIRRNPEKFHFMLKRRGLPNAGFEDIPMDTPLYDPEHPFIDVPKIPEGEAAPSNEEYRKWVVYEHGK
ncbi:hypothetical protein BGZ83_001192 [Gryganskiella cystojenkinii]|nr:hypothetical protein BGZ83_001192 [Gryganskiella cystojenkinii]